MKNARDSDEFEAGNLQDDLGIEELNMFILVDHENESNGNPMHILAPSESLDSQHSIFIHPLNLYQCRQIDMGVFGETFHFINIPQELQIKLETIYLRDGIQCGVLHLNFPRHDHQQCTESECFVCPQKAEVTFHFSEVFQCAMICNRLLWFFNQAWLMGKTGADLRDKIDLFMHSTTCDMNTMRLTKKFKQASKLCTRMKPWHNLLASRIALFEKRTSNVFCVPLSNWKKTFVTVFDLCNLLCEIGEHHRKDLVVGSRQNWGENDEVDFSEVSPTFRCHSTNS